MDQLFERTTDNDNLIRVSYLMDVCDGAINVPMGDVDDHCDRFMDLQESSKERYLALIQRLRDQAQANREADDFHGGAQVVLMFIDEDSMDPQSYDLIIAAREAAYELEIVVVDLNVQTTAGYLTNIRRDREVVRLQEGTLEVQGAAVQDMLDMTCRGFNMDVF